MTARSRDMLFARLQLSAPDARAFLIAAADSTSTSEVAEDLAASIAKAGLTVRLVELVRDESPDEPDDQKVQRQVLSSESKGNLSGLGQALKGFDGYTVLSGGSLIDHAATLLATKSADAVVLVASRGKTSRTDLARCKAEVQRAGSLVIGAVLKT